MSEPLPGFVQVLLRQGTVRPEQVDEARALVRQTSGRWENALVGLGHVTAEDVLLAWGEYLHLRVVDLVELTIPADVIALVPESVARENVLLPVACAERLIVLAVSDPTDSILLERLAFILAHQIQLVLAPSEQIVEAINRHYGQSETESVDSMLAEFADTTVDFAPPQSTAVPSTLPTPAPGSAPVPAPPPAGRAPAAAESLRQRSQRSAETAGKPVERRATVRYYERMNPERLYPLLVILSQTEIARIPQANVGQQQSESFQVRTESLVEIEPILPGCDCYPPRATVRITPGDVQAEFWVAPRVLGKLRSARVLVRQEGQTLAEVPLEADVGKQAITWLLAGLSLVLPFVLLLLKHFRLDFDSQREDGYGVYAHAANWVIGVLTPETLTLLLLAATVSLYLWLRPRQRDLFWDIHPRRDAETHP